MSRDPNDAIVKPKKPIYSDFLGANKDLNYMKAKKEYRKDRNRWLKALKKEDAHVKEVDESIEEMKDKKVYRKKKDSTWKKEQLNQSSAARIDFMRAEAIQVAAMAIRFIIDCGEIEIE